MNGSQISLVLCLVAQFIDQELSAGPDVALSWEPWARFSEGSFSPQHTHGPSAVCVFPSLAVPPQNKGSRCGLGAPHTHSDIWK